MQLLLFKIKLRASYMYFSGKFSLLSITFHRTTIRTFEQTFDRQTLSLAAHSTRFPCGPTLVAQLSSILVVSDEACCLSRLPVGGTSVQW